MRVVVGLGNPGRAYAATRHNVGFMVVEGLARRWCLSLDPTRDGMRTAHGTVHGVEVMLVEPQLYMNRSGDPLARIAPPLTAAQLIVVHDDVDLECARVKVKRDGGTGGHRGLESLVAYFGDQFTRVRVGIGRPPQGTEMVDHVLSAFDDDERDRIASAIERAADAVEHVLRFGEAAAMNQFNTRSTGAQPLAAVPMGRS